MLEPLFGDFAIGDIRQRPRHSFGNPIFTPNRQAAAEHPAVSTIFVKHTVLIFIMGGQAFDMVGNIQLGLLDIFRVNPVEPFG